MLFNSAEFLLFFVVVVGVYYALGNWRWQNYMLLAASYVFYGAWDWRFLALIWISTLVDYSAGRAMGRVADRAGRRPWLLLSLIVNLGMLGFFKYWDFGIESMTGLLEGLGFQVHVPTLRVILPVGISFYTFQTISYSVDVYRGERKACGDLPDFALYVAFFPQLVAGPIERSTRLLPQLQRSRESSWKQWQSGLWLMLLGYFKKVVLADSIAPLVDDAFGDPEGVGGVTMVLAMLGFAVQIYGDFAGYSLIARGAARLFGIELMRNFDAPYLARSPREFWTRWHISLSSWLREYLYFPLGGSRGTKWRTYRNLMVTMLLGGLWHGAAWNFVLWGGYHGMLLVLTHALAKEPKRVPRRVEARDLPGMVTTFAAILLGWLLFRVDSMDQLGRIVDVVVNQFVVTPSTAVVAIPVLSAFGLLQGYHLWQNNVGEENPFARSGPFLQGLAVCCMLWAVLAVGVRPNPFIYFQF